MPIIPFLVKRWSPSTAPPVEVSRELFARVTTEGVFITTGDLGMPGDVGGLARGAELIECAPRLWWNRLVVTLVKESVLKPFALWLRKVGLGSADCEEEIECEYGLENEDDVGPGVGGLLPPLARVSDGSTQWDEGIEG
jgi:hypothetical protein